MVGFAKSKEAFLRKFLELPSGIPSRDTINRAFSAISSEQFESCFVDWVNSIADLSKGQIIAIDGKTIRGAKSHGKKSPIHMVGTQKKIAMNSKRLEAGWNDDYLLKILNLKV